MSGQQFYSCAWCGKPVLRYPSRTGKRVFCSKTCRINFLSKDSNPDGYIRHSHLSEYNEVANKSKMTPETREKLRDAHAGSGTGKTYPKIYGRHAHRVAAEKMLGRPLKPGEVVHHIDRDKQNSNPENLMVFKSQSEHAAYHKLHDGKEVMPK